MQNKTYRRNLISSTALTAGTKTSQLETATWGRGVRFYITVSGATGSGSADSVFLTAAAPSAQGTPIPVVGVAGINILATNGTYVVDFYPGLTLPSSLASGGKLLGAVGVHLPTVWGVQLVLGSGNASTIAVDAELLP